MLPAKATAPPSLDRLPTMAFGPFAFDRQAQILRRDGSEIPLPPRVLGVLDLLVARAGEIVPRQELIDAVWKEAFVTDTSLAEAISFLRQTLGDDPQAPTYVQTVHRRGYRFVAPVRNVERAPAAARAEPAGRAPDVEFPTVAGHLIPWTIAVLSLGLAASAVWQYAHVQPIVPPVVRLAIDTGATSLDTRAPALAMSPDGSMVAWSACTESACRLYVRQLGGLDAAPVAGSEDASAPFFSPDGRWIGFFAGGKLKKVAVAGGSPITLTDAPQTYGAVWLPDGRIVFAASAYGGLQTVADRGGESAALTLPNAGAGELRHAWPSSAADGRAILFSIATSPLESAPARIAILQSDGVAGRTTWRTLVEGADVARTAGRDHLVFSRGQELHAVYFDSARLVTAGPEQLVQGIIAPMQFALSETGAMVYAVKPADRTAAFVTGLPEGSRPGMLESPALSPDGRRLAGVGADGASSDIWVADVNRGPTTRLTHGGVNVAPVWSGDAASVLFASLRHGSFEIWRRDLAGSAAESRVLARPGRHVFPTSVSRDSRLMAVVESGGPTRADVEVVPIDGGAPLASIRTPFDEVGGVLSDDGRMLAYQSDESGRWQIYLMSLADRRRLAVSTSGGTHPFWYGSQLLFTSGDELVSVGVDPSGREISATPSRRPLHGAEPFAMTADLLFSRNAGGPAPRSLVLTLEWLRELRQKVGAPVTLPR